MSDKPMLSIKTAEERIHPMALDDKSVWCNAYFDEVAELRAAYEALENERDDLKQGLEDLQERFNGIKFIESELRKENEAQAKRIAELEHKAEMLNDMLDLLKINKENWFSLYSVVAELKSKNGE